MNDNQKSAVANVATATAVVFAAGYVVGSIINRVSGSIQLNLKDAKSSKPQQ